jgi:hypothetical protein
MGGDADAAADDGDPGRRRGLPRDGDERLHDTQHLPAEVQDAADLEHHDAGAGRGQGGAQRSGAIRVEVRDPYDVAAAPAGRGRRPADGAGESGCLGRRRLRHGDAGENGAGDQGKLQPTGCQGAGKYLFMHVLCSVQPTGIVIREAACHR